MFDFLYDFPPAGMIIFLCWFVVVVVVVFFLVASFLIKSYVNSRSFVAGI